MRGLGTFLVAGGLLLACWGVVAFGFLVDSPDSDWVTGLEYGGPFVVGGSVAVAVGLRLRRGEPGR